MEKDVVDSLINEINKNLPCNQFHAAARQAGLKHTKNVPTKTSQTGLSIVVDDLAQGDAKGFSIQLGGLQDDFVEMVDEMVGKEKTGVSRGER